MPPTLTDRVRLLGSSKGSKNDPNDAYATAIAGLRHCGLRTVTRDGHTAILRLLADRHHDLVGLRTQSACRLHVMLRELSAGGAPIRISAAHGTRFHDAVDVGDDPVAVEGSDSRASISPTCDDSMPSSPRSIPASRKRKPALVGPLTWCLLERMTRFELATLTLAKRVGARPLCSPTGAGVVFRPRIRPPSGVLSVQ